METISRDYVLMKKEEDRKTIKGLERHADGACIHIGKISPGCRICFTAESGGGIQVGQECNAKCSVCYYDRDRTDEWESPERNLDLSADFFRQTLNPKWMPLTYAYQSAGETLKYIDKLMNFGPLFRSYEKHHNINIYHYIYSNGSMITEEILDKLEWLRVKEFRFHVSATGWKDSLFRKMEMTRDRGITVSVEEPSYPIERENILKHLKTFEEVGVKHLNMVEVQMTEPNKPEIEDEYPEGRIYKDHFYQLYDEGLCYEVMREVEAKNYSFSVLDCNSHVENHRQVKNQPLGFNMETIRGMCAPFDYGDRPWDI